MILEGVVELIDSKSAEYAKFNLVLAKGKDGAMDLRREMLTPIREDLQQIIEEQKT